MHYRTMSSFLVMLLCVWVGFAAQADANEATLTGSVTGEPELLSLTSSADFGAKPSVKVLDKDDTGMLLELEIPGLKIQELEVEGELFHALEIEGGAYRGEVGSPMLPTFSRMVQIPDGAGITFEVISSVQTEISGYRPMPMQPGKIDGFSFNAEAYSQSGYEDIPVFTIGEPAIARDLRVVPMTFNPVRYNPESGTIEVATRVEVRINYAAGADQRNPAPQPRALIPESFHNLYKDLVVNYEGPRDDQEIGLGMYVIICPNNSTVINLVQPLLDWRERKGYDVYLATTSETGTSKENIKNWIQSAYNSWPNPPAHITLIGDTGGSISIPYWTENYSNYHGESDFPYAMLEGSDPLGDVHIGRITVSSTTELQRYVYKVTSYESTPNMSSPAWYGHGVVCGDPSSSGPTCVQQMQWLKREMITQGYTSVDTIFSSPYVSGMVNNINDGCTIFGYRGYYHMSGFDTGDAGNLQNGYKMPFCVISTCDTGSFSGYARSEALMRCGSGATGISGGIAAIGTATTGTHTRFNNCITYGIWRGIFHGLPEFGAALTRGKYELYQNYGYHDLNDTYIFAHWNNLMGDSAGECWTGIPQSITVSYDNSIAVGSNSVPVTVTAGGGPLAGAFVCLLKSNDDIQSRGYTDANGQIELPIDDATAGNLLITVTKHDHIPHLGTINISQETRFVGYNSHTIDGNGLANPNEAIDLSVQVRNFGSQSASSVNGTITVSDPYVTITDNNTSFGTVNAGATAWGNDAFDLNIASTAPDGHVIQVGLDATSSGDTWHTLVEVPVSAPAFGFRSMALSGAGTLLDPGESGTLTVEVVNTGSVTATGVTATLISGSPWVSISDANGSYPNIGVGSSGANTGNSYGLSAAGDCFNGHMAELKIAFSSSGGAIDTLSFVMQIGEPSDSDPTGPDAYGYYAFDNTDTSYDQAPTYNWLEIDPNRGGSGSDVGLNDNSWGDDDSKVINLPFDFTYYGETFSRATICSNGWMAMGSTHLVNYRNWTIPAAGAPLNMIAPMWDNHRQSGNDQVYQWYDAANHRYVVEWSRVRNEYGNGTSTFEVILYDPEFHSTDTEDGIIEFQFNQYGNTDSEQHYSTTGIQNGDNSTGVEYAFWAGYNDNAAPISAGRAIRFVPVAGFPRGTFTGHVTNASFGGADLPGVSIVMEETGTTLVTNEDGYYSGSIQTGLYTVTASLPGFAPFTYNNVSIIEGQSTNRNFSLTDIAGPYITGTTQLENTLDNVGPYNVSTMVFEYSGLEELSLYYNVAGSGWVGVALTDEGNNLYSASIPGGPFNTMVSYYIYGRDGIGQESTDPPAGSSDPYTFWVLPPVFSDDIEDGEGNWTHDNVQTGYGDQWHRSSTRNHTDGGGYSWKFGDTGGGDYSGEMDGALESELFTVSDGGATIYLWHWMEAEQRDSNPVQGYDGGFIEMSFNGGDWEQVTPESGYTHVVRVGANGPYPEDMPFFSGSIPWTQLEIDLGDFEGTAQIRFRFGSDDNTHREGWYIDDVMIVPNAPSLADAEEIELFPTRMALYQNSPNPFSSSVASTRIRFELPKSSKVTLKVYDTSGRLVRTLANSPLDGGSHSVSWNGRDSHDRQVGSGIYYYVLNSDGKNQSRQMLILK
jgi:Peptidase family C25/Propeptide_C25/Carboxypeptidase regulatory-like domain/FlgD Ig-like domain